MNSERTLGLACVVCVLGLMALLGAWHGAALPPAGIPVSLAVTSACLPLAFLLPGLWRCDRRSCTRGSLLIVLYIGYSVMELVANPVARGWATAAFTLSFTLLGLLVLAARRWHR